MFKQVIRILSILMVSSTIGLGSCIAPQRLPEFLATPSAGAKNEVTHTPTSQAELIELPAPRQKGSLSFEEVLAKRRSLRQFSDDPLTLEQIGQ